LHLDAKLSPAERARLFAAACAALCIFGIVLTLLGTCFGLPHMRQRLQLDLVRQGNLQSVLFIGVLLATLVVGPLIDRFGNKSVLFVSSTLAAVGFGAFAAAGSYDAAWTCALLLGAGGGGLNTSANVLVSDLFEQDRGPRLNLLGLFFGVGALFFPLLAGVFSEQFNAIIVAAALVSAAAACAFALLPFPRGHEAHGFTFSGVLRVARYPGLLLFAVLLFFQSGNETLMSGWTSTWAAGVGATPRAATLLLAAFQACMMIGRMLATLLLRRISKVRLVAASAAGAVAGTSLMLSSPSVLPFALGVALVGLSLAAVYPTTLAMAGDRYQRFSGTVFGILFALALPAAVLFPFLTGHIAQAAGVRTGILMPLAGAAMVGVMIMVIRRRHSSTAPLPARKGRIGSGP
jgi:fucose permease